jgi:very-short-patch-repair endonuclease
MFYLTYDKEFQNEVINCKESGYKVRDVCKKFNISVYTLYKILHMNNKMPTPSEDSEGKGSEERVEHRYLSPNNNNIQERSVSTWRGYKNDRHCKIEHKCLNCKKTFYARDRGKRTKFCSIDCRGKYNTFSNSACKRCDNCGKEFTVNNSQSNNTINCKDCRKLNLRSPSSKNARSIGKWLNKHFKLVESEKTFDWFYDINKPKGKFRLDYFLPELNIGIEYDGEQHFKPCFTSKWESVSKVKYKDELKNKLCNDHGIKILRFRYDDDLSENSMLIKIYAELQGNQPVEV